MSKLRRSWALAGAALLLAAGCTGQSGTGGLRADTAGGETPARASSGGAPDSASAVLRQVMEADVFTNPATHPAADTLVACPPDVGPERTVALADFTILSLREAGDTAVATVEITTVARQRPSARVADRFVADLGVRTDTVHQVMVRTPAGTWKVCGQPQEGTGFVHAGRDGQTDWSTAGASWDAVPRMVDSVRAARRGSGRPR